MAKKRKTRAQKKLSDFRHNFTHSINQASTSFQINLEKKAPAMESLSSYPYLIKDLTKTTFLTLSIMGAQLILYFALTHHLFKIPGFNY